MGVFFFSPRRYSRLPSSSSEDGVLPGHTSSRRKPSLRLVVSLALVAGFLALSALGLALGTDFLDPSLSSALNAAEEMATAEEQGEAAAPAAGPSQASSAPFPSPSSPSPLSATNPAAEDPSLASATGAHPILLHPHFHLPTPLPLPARSPLPYPAPSPACLLHVSRAQPLVLFL